MQEGKIISASQKMIDKEIYKEKIETETSDIWGDDDEIETIPFTEASRPSSQSTNKTI